jgi:hypothetical protein
MSETAFDDAMRGDFNALHLVTHNLEKQSRRCRMTDTELAEADAWLEGVFRPWLMSCQKGPEPEPPQAYRDSEILPRKPCRPII